eukprot:Amastigsp_a24_481.p3 type:complete len:125 gc:universal Amastigsp_a24_481:490-116(-)
MSHGSARKRFAVLNTARRHSAELRGLTDDADVSSWQIAPWKTKAHGRKRTELTKSSLGRRVSRGHGAIVLKGSEPARRDASEITWRELQQMDSRCEPLRVMHITAVRTQNVACPACAQAPSAGH